MLNRFSFKHALFIATVSLIVLEAFNYEFILSATNLAADTGSTASAAVGNSIMTISNTNDFDVARLESNGFFDDITSTHWQRLKDIMAEAKDHKWDYKGNPELSTSIKFWANVRFSNHNIFCTSWKDIIII